MIRPLIHTCRVEIVTLSTQVVYLVHHQCHIKWEALLHCLPEQMFYRHAPVLATVAKKKALQTVYPFRLWPPRGRRRKASEGTSLSARVRMALVFADLYIRIYVDSRYVCIYIYEYICIYIHIYMK
jgi:hypothetical protein